MKNFSNLTYTYAGRKYTFTAFMYVNKSDNEKDGNYLVNDNVVLFLYENILNLLYLKGELIYVDRYGVVDRFLEKQFVYCQIQNIMHETNVDGDVSVEKLSQSIRFQLNFFVDGIEIRERKGNDITYRIKLISQNWMNCISNIKYSNYNTQPEEIFDIVKGILSQVDLTAHKETFDAIKSNVKISYIANDNDNVLTSVQYLLHKLYYFMTKDVSMKFIVYNETEDRYQLFDLANLKFINGTSMLVISMFKSLSEIQLLQYPTLLATITKFPKQLTFQNMFMKEFYDYSRQYNSFIDRSISSTSIIDYRNEKPLTTEEVYEKKYKPYNSTLQYKQSGTYWNNDFDIYGEFANILNDDNALVTTVDADLLRKPGAYVEVSLDRDNIKIAGEDDIRKLEETKNKYKALEGLWFVGKVRHIISPRQAKYQLNLVLFRNFVKKLK